MKRFERQTHLPGDRVGSAESLAVSESRSSLALTDGGVVFAAEFLPLAAGLDPVLAAAGPLPLDLASDSPGTTS